MTAPALMLFAWGLEALFGWPDWLYRLIRHPVVWLGWAIQISDRLFNRPQWPAPVRYSAGMLISVIIVSSVTMLAWGIGALLPDTILGFAAQAVIAATLLASRSLYSHVAAVARALQAGNLGEARDNVAKIVGRESGRMTEDDIARASLESLAENTSDGVTAPLFWGALLGLPGLATYKAINTLDSMIGHRSERYAAFGGFAARLDDIANLIPARLTGLLFCLAAFSQAALKIMIRDARKHRSPNAGWPEAAMAGALKVRLSGPRIYGQQVHEEPWLNVAARDPGPHDLRAGLRLYQRAMLIAALALGLIAAAVAWL